MISLQSAWQFDLSVLKFTFRSPAEELEVTSPTSRFNMSLAERVLNKSIRKQVSHLYPKSYWWWPWHLCGLHMYWVLSKLILKLSVELLSSTGTKFRSTKCDMYSLYSKMSQLTDLWSNCIKSTENKASDMSRLPIIILKRPDFHLEVWHWWSHVKRFPLSQSRTLPKIAWTPPSCRTLSV